MTPNEQNKTADTKVQFFNNISELVDGNVALLGLKKALQSGDVEIVGTPTASSEVEVVQTRNKKMKA